MKRSLGICIKHNFRESIILICHSIVVRSFDRSIVWLFCHSAFCSHRNHLLFWVSICLGARLWRFFVNMNYITSYCSSSDTTPSTILNSVNAWMKAYDICFFYAFDSSIRTSFILITDLSASRPQIYGRRMQSNRMAFHAFFLICLEKKLRKKNRRLLQNGSVK